MDDSLLLRPAAELAGLVRSGEVSARELVEASLERIEALNPDLNAFTLVDDERALAAADAIAAGDERPFCGVPVAIKDLAVAVEGMRMTNGSDLFGEFAGSGDSFLTRRLREAGCVLVGRTNTPEFGITPVTEPRRFGPTRNPWDRDRTPGGSSGGSAAAVASGMVPVANASDGGGSIRIPAACCGLFGLKPARNRISPGPTMGESLLSTQGILTRTVADSAALLDVMAGYEPGDANWAPPPAEPFAAAAAREPGKLRIAVTTKPALLEADLDPVCAGAVRDAAELLAGLGHEVEEVEPPWGDADLLELFTDVWAAVTGIGVAFGGIIAGRDPVPDDVEPLSWWLYERARAMDSLRFGLEVGAGQGLSRVIVGFCLGYDAILTPVVSQRPLPIGSIDPCGSDPAAEFRKSADFAPFTALFNLTGQPAMSVPLFQGDDGLPLAVQIAGPPAGEGLLLSLAAQLEAAHPWAERVPALATA